MKKFLTMFLALTILFSVAILCASCSDDECEHVYSEKVIENTCALYKIEYICQNCDYSYQRELPTIISHDYSENILENTCASYKVEYNCKNCEYSYQEQKDPVVSHSYKDDGVCNGCGNFNLQYVAYECEYETRNYDEPGYILKKYTGNAQHVVVPSWIDDIKVVAIAENAFENNTNIKTVVIPNTNIKVESHAFKGCMGLEKITLPYESRNIYANVDAVCFSMLFGGYNLHHDNSSYMPQSLTHVVFNDNPTKIYEYSFYKCKYLQTIELGDEVVEIEEMAFVDCESLKNFDIPAKTEKIGSYAFMGCDSLTSMTIPGRIKTISYGMLSDCNLLETVVIEEGVENISGNAFVLTKLKNLILPSTIKNIEQRAFGSDGLEWVVLSEGSCLETIAKDAFLDYNMTKKFFVFEEKNSFEQKVGVLDSVDIYYYSDKNPTTEGNYWHYVNNKPTPW